MRHVARTFTALLLVTASPAAFAQTVQPDTGGGTGDTPATGNDTDIIVTSQKIEQRAIDVPITISVKTGKDLERLGISDLDDISAYIPGLNIQDQSPNNPGFVIRGITSDSGSAQQSARVTVYYNGVDISRARGAYQDLYDINRIEVVKGPQATLFGTAAAIGAISIISNKPQPGYSGELTIGYGNYNQKLVRGYINAGSDTLAGRIAFAWKKRDGYVKNLSPDQGDLNGQNQLGIRASLRWRPSDAVTVDLIGTYDRQRNPGTAFVSGNFATPAGPADPLSDVADLGGSPYSAQVLGAPHLGLRRHVYDTNLTINWDMGDGWKMTMVNGYRRFLDNEVFDADGSAAWYLEFAEDAEGWQASHETRFNYTSDTFRGAFGFNVFHEQGFQRVPFSTEEGTYLQCTLHLIPGLGCVAADGSVPASQATGILTGGQATVLPYASVFENGGKNDSYSVFGDMTWIPTPKLELTAGARGIIEQRISTYSATQPNSVLAGAPLLPVGNTDGQTVQAQRSFVALLPRFNALYHLNGNLNLYATISKGRRSPVVQLTGPLSTLDIVPEETVWNYEAGIKGSAGIVSGSLGVYYDDYKDFQVSVIQSNGTTITQSAGSAKNLGVEAELNVRPTDWFSMFANMGFISGGIDNKPENGVYAGDQFRLQPKWQAAGGLTVDKPVGNGMRLFATPSITYRSKIYFEVPNSEATSQGPVTLVNIRAGISFDNDRFEIAGVAHNLLNRHYLLDAGNTGGGFGYPTYIPAEPRLYSIRLTARF
ncbi:TonB-dependent receptor [Stakelama sediminis]|uniref:Outer membrane receptor protein involved in Fe transport n=1 Tax=Stakelama sediminis TaxID=463200 RepID=A0A840YX36_9SPHN|nr:TonB-dependent receptor [Stakelama sediminis]MBB5718213.1 outer membrane receptor protein involved in Fe transport [Stakelama sediminis]